MVEVEELNFTDELKQLLMNVGESDGGILLNLLTKQTLFPWTQLTLLIRVAKLSSLRCACVSLLIAIREIQTGTSAFSLQCVLREGSLEKKPKCTPYRGQDDNGFYRQGALAQGLYEVEVLFPILIWKATRLADSSLAKLIPHDRSIASRIGTRACRGQTFAVQKTT